MFAFAVELVVADTGKASPQRGFTGRVIGASLCGYGFRRVQSSLYVTENEDMAKSLAPAPLGARLGGAERVCGRERWVNESLEPPA